MKHFWNREWSVILIKDEDKKRQGTHVQKHLGNLH